MIELRTLGALDLRDDRGHELRAILTQPKRLALLTYLAVAGRGGFVRRDMLLAMFWPESDEEHARASLRQALRGLRKVLGDGVIIARGDREVGLDRERFTCDVWKLHAADEASDVAGVVEHYGGAFLTGFSVDGLAEFQRWADTERDRLDRRCSEALRQLAMRAVEDDDPGAAVQWWRQLTQHDPHSGDAAVGLMTALEAVGDRPGAVRHAEEHAKRVVEDLGVDPDSRVHSAMERLRTNAANESPPSPRPFADSDVKPLPASTAVAGSPSLPARTPWKLKRRGIVAVAIVTVATIGSLVFIVLARGGNRGTNDPDLIAVLPFRVISPDTSLDYLRMGMLDILHAKLTGDGIPRAVDVRTLLSAWRREVENESNDLSADQSLRLATSFGAGRILLGEVVSLRDDIEISARIFSAPDGHLLAETTVSGGETDQSIIVDRLVGQLFGLEQGLDVTRIPALSDSLAANKAYFEGRRAYRAGEWLESIAHYERAVAIDSSFAMGWLGITEASQGNRPDAGRRAWQLRSRLSPRDRSYMRAFHWIGPNYPDPWTVPEIVAAGEDALSATPNRAEAWRLHGEMLLYYGNYGGVPNALERAVAALDRAVALDSTYIPGTELRLLAALRSWDTTAVRALSALYDSLSSPSGLRDAVRWWTGRVLGDSTLAAKSRARFPEFADFSVWVMPGFSIFGDLPLDDARLAIEAREKSATLSNQWRGLHAASRATIAIVQGLPREAAYLVDSLLAPAGTRIVMVQQALIEPGYERAASDAVSGLVAQADTVETAEDLCYRELWRVSRGDTSATRGVLKSIGTRARPWGADFFAVGPFGVCTMLIETMLEWAGPVPSRSPALDRLDSLMKLGPGLEAPYNIANIMIARWRAKQGDHHAALAAVRRFPQAPWVSLFSRPVFPPYLREEGRLAAIVGDTAGAIRAYQHYLTLRPDPDGPLEAEVRDVRAHLENLLRGTSEK